MLRTIILKRLEAKPAYVEPKPEIATSDKQYQDGQMLLGCRLGSI